MNTSSSNQSSSIRAGRTALPALLVVGLLMGVTISAIKPGVRALHRDAAAELQATRQFARTIVRAVRDWSGQHVRVLGGGAIAVTARQAPCTEVQGPPEVGLPLGYSMPRPSLLSLPPPEV